MGVLAVLDRHHLAGDARLDEVHRDVGEGRRDQRVERIGLAAAEVVGELGGERLDPRPLAQLERQGLADIGLVPVAERVGAPDVGHLGALPDRALGRDDEGVVARVRGVVGLEQGGQRVEVVRRLGDDAARRGHVCRVQRREPGVPPEDPEDADPLVAAERRALPVDRLLGAGDRGREADAVLGPLDVVVHRLGDGHERHAGVHQHLRVRQRVVAADGHQDVDAERGDVVEDERRQVVEVVADRVACAAAARPSTAAARPRASCAGSSARCAGRCRRSARSSGC